MSDAVRLMQYDANKKSAVVAYVFWFFLGIFGAHRFYLGNSGSGAAMLIITLLSLVFMFVAIGFVTIWISVIWVCVDLFLIPGITRSYNNRLAIRLGAMTGQQRTTPTA